MSTPLRAGLLSACVMLVVAPHGVATAAATKMTLAASAGSHSMRVSLQDPCAGDTFSGLVRSVTGAGAFLPGAVAIATLHGDLLQADAWSGEGKSSTPTTIGCNNGGRRRPGTYLVTIVAQASVHISTLLIGPATVDVTAPSRATLRVTVLKGAQAATSGHEEQKFSTSSAAVALFSESIYSAHVASVPNVCIRRTSGACSDGIALIFPGANTVTSASHAVQDFSGSGFATFEEQPVAVRTHRTDTTVILPR